MLTAFACTRETPAPTACGKQRTGVTAAASAPSDDRGLRVAERGFTQLPRAGSPSIASLGAVVENISTLVAYHTRVRFTAFDAQRASAVPPQSGELLYQEIPVILPGQRIPVGAWTYVREDERRQDVVVAGFDVELTTAQWWPRANDVHRFASVTTKPGTVRRNGTDDRWGTLTYTAVSHYCGTVARRGIATVFRDGGGTLVGGSFAPPGSGDQCPKPDATVPGEAPGVAPPGLDAARTDVMPYCDPVDPIARSGTPPRASPSTDPLPGR